MIFILTKVFIFQILISLIIIKISKKKGLLDKPNLRKIHKKPIPYTGGIILSLTFVFIIFVTKFNSQFLNLILAYSLIISLTGLLDDRYSVNPGTKLLLQSIPIFFLIDQNLYLTNLGFYNSFGFIELGSMDKIFTFLSCLLLINACNYSDGIDGLLPSISIIILGSFSTFLLFLESDNYKDIILILFPLIIFLFFNLGILNEYKIFLGDSGSNLLGFLIAFIAIFIYIEKNVHPAIIVWPLAYIVYEFLSVTILRIVHNSGTFKPGKDHLHYEIMKLFNFNQIKTVTIILIVNVFVIILGCYIFTKLGPVVSIAMFILFFVFYFG